MNTKVIAICNQKGGCGKTATAVNLGTGLARQGRKVLLADTDPQADLTACLGWKDPDSLQLTLTDLMEDFLQDRQIRTGDAIIKTPEGADLLPADLELSGMELRLVNAMSRENAVRRIISGVRGRYDYVIIDCMPSLGILTVNALAASDSVMIPVQSQYLAAKGMTQLVKTVGSVNRHINPLLKIDGIVMTMVDRRTNLSRDISAALKEEYGSVIHVYKAQIPSAVRVAESAAAGQSIYRYDKNSPAAKAYENLTKEVIKRHERTRESVRSSEAR